LEQFFHPAFLAEFRAYRERHEQILALLARLEEKVNQIMSEDAAVAAAAADLQTDAATLTTALTALQGIVAALQAEVANNPNVVQPATLTALQTAQAAVDAITGTASADVTADQPPAAAAPAAG
jgi:small-conductance mechanosensitive channel